MRLRDDSLSRQERITDWVAWHYRNGALDEQEAEDLRVTISGCTTEESYISTLRSSNRATECMHLIALGAWARIGLLIEQGLLIRGIRRGATGDSCPLLDFLLTQKNEPGAESRAFGRYLLRVREWLPGEMSWADFADTFMPVRTPQTVHDRENLKRHLRAWRNEGRLPNQSSLRCFAENIADFVGTEHRSEIRAELIWASHLAVAVDRFEAEVPRKLLGKAVGRQRRMIEAWLPVSESTRPR